MAAPHPYRGRRAVVATMHGKESAIAPAMAALGLRVEPAHGLDTDRFGTFTGEVERPGPMRQTAIAKARAGIASSGCPLAIASEGSYGPHPHFPAIAAGLELMVLVDAERDLVIAEERLLEDVTFAQCEAASVDALAAFLAGIGFPDQGVIVRPNGRRAGGEGLFKGLTDHAALARAVAEAAARSADGLAFVETDMRAHLNPRRRAALAGLAERLASRLLSLCPACGAPGFGPVRAERGLPCADCGLPTPLARAEVLGCGACDHLDRVGRSDGLTRASPAACPLCNP
ncbi:MAG: hypothetical protein HXY25_10265 [Alphaproteobacteria bacterium]|nr:hypothetical protein [Alphaproteobacteria bacterium]